MKEVTYEDWQKNPTPRMMRVWNNLVCGKCDCKMAEVCGFFSTRPAYWVCPRCKYKVKNADYIQ